MRYAVAVLALFLAPKLVACSCVTTGEVVPLGTIKTHYPIVFTGIVESIDDSDVKRIRSLPPEGQSAAFSNGELRRHVTFRTMQVWRSDVATTNRFVIETGEGGGDCGYPFHEGQSYLVFANRARDGSATTGICSATIALACSINRLEELGPADKTYESIDRAHLIAREQPYAVYWMGCVKPAVLLTDRNLKMDRHCQYAVDGVIDRDGSVSKFEVKTMPFPQSPGFCPSIADVVAHWKFEPATIDGEPVAVRLEHVSVSQPMTKTEYDDELARQKKWLEEHPPKKP